MQFPSLIGFCFVLLNYWCQWVLGYTRWYVLSGPFRAFMALRCILRGYAMPWNCSERVASFWGFWKLPDWRASAPDVSHPLLTASNWSWLHYIGGIGMYVCIIYSGNLHYIEGPTTNHIQTRTHAHRHKQDFGLGLLYFREYYFLNLRHENANLMSKDIKENHIYTHILCSSVWTVEHVVYLLSTNKIQKLLHRLSNNWLNSNPLEFAFVRACQRACAFNKIQFWVSKTINL